MQTPLPFSAALDMARLGRLRSRQLSTFDPERRTKTARIECGQKVEIGSVEGHGVVTALWLTFPGWFWQHWNTEAPIDASILKTLILRIYFDGATRPSVEAPAGDLFGSGLCEPANFASRYLGMSSGGFFLRFPMPFRQGFRIEVENLDTTINTDVFLNALYQECDELPDELGCFHAQFRTGHNPGPEPLPLCAFEGQGRYAGCTLSMQGQDLNTMYFLEAPEYVWIDDDGERPGIVGTGLEDYFMGGWYFREGPFCGPLHGVPVKDSLRATIAMYRVHEADAIHFRRRLRMDFVNPFDPERLRPFAHSSVAFAYLDTPEGQGLPLPDRERLLVWYRRRDVDHQSIP